MNVNSLPNLTRYLSPRVQPQTTNMSQLVRTFISLSAFSFALSSAQWSNTTGQWTNTTSQGTNTSDTGTIPTSLGGDCTGSESFTFCTQTNWGGYCECLNTSMPYTQFRLCKPFPAPNFSLAIGADLQCKFFHSPSCVPDNATTDVPTGYGWLNGELNLPDASPLSNKGFQSWYCDTKPF